MHIEQCTIENLGPIKKVELTFDPRFNVLTGVNGAGKSTILRALSVMLGRYHAAVRTGRASGTFSREQVRKKCASASVAINLRTDFIGENSSVSWFVRVSRPGNNLSTLSSSANLNTFARQVAQSIEHSPEGSSLPFAVFYTVNRAVLDIPLRVRTKIDIAHYSVLTDALNQGSGSFRTFFSWFRDREDVENELRAEGYKTRDRQLSAVRSAISAMLPGFDNLRVRRQPLRMLITKNDVDLQVDELSDGEKCLLAMVGDLARRLAVANPGLKNPLKGAAIVLIDEIELHLHPAWQRNAVNNLQHTFPNCQFIVTTHSPQVISEAQPNGIVLLRDGVMSRPSRSYGRDSNLILQELMGTSERPLWASDSLEKLYELIDDEDFTEARKELENLEQYLGASDPGLTAARTLLRKR